MAPQRSKQQILEDKTRDEFPRHLPDHWVVRNIEKDYGIDVEVELFEEATDTSDAQATGIMFKVQLKATHTRAGKAPSVDVRFSHYEYWHNVDTPVLIVLYVEDENTFYCKWAVAHDPGRRKPNIKWTRVSFESSDLLLQRVPTIRPDIEILRAVKAGHFPKPLPIQVESDLPAVSHYAIMREFRSQLDDKDLHDQLVIAPDSQQAAMKVTVSKTLLRVSMPLNAGSISLHALAAAQDIAADVHQVIANVVVLVGANLAKAGRSHDALQLVEAFPVCAALTSPEVAQPIAGAIHDEKRPLVGLIVAYPMLESDDDELAEIGYFYLLGVLLDVERLPDDAAAVFLETLEKYAARCLALGLTEGAGAVHFNISQACRVLGLYPQAFDALMRAQELKPGYQKSAEYFTLLGGTAYRADLPGEAAVAYEQAVRLGDRSPETLRDLADSLFWAGKYKETSSVLAGSHGQPLTDRLSVVNAAAAREIRSVLGIEQQSRRAISDQEIDEVESDPSVADRLLHQIDALQSRLWFLRDPAIETWTLDRILLHCRLDLQNGYLWAYATVRAYEEAREDLFPVIVEIAINDASDDYIDALLELLAEDTGADAKSILDYTQSVASTFHRPEPPVTLFGSDGLPEMRLDG